MPHIETVEDLSEWLADRVVAYGCGPEHGDHTDDCDCRICFVDSIGMRIRRAVDNERMLAAACALKETTDAD